MKSWLAYAIVGLACLTGIGSSLAAATDGAAVPAASQRQELEKAVDDVTFAIIEGDVDVLMPLCQLKDSFQFDKKFYLQQFLSRYTNTSWTIGSVEIAKIKVVPDDEAKVMVKVHLSAVDTSGGLGAAPRAEIWKFVKGKDGSQRDKWLLLVEK